MAKPEPEVSKAEAPKPEKAKTKIQEATKPEPKVQKPELEKPKREPEATEQEPETHKAEVGKPQPVHPLSKPEPMLVLQKPKPEVKEVDAEVKLESRLTTKQLLKKGIECLLTGVCLNIFNSRVKLQIARTHWISDN